MRKLILLFTIACATGQLYGMEPQNILEAQNIMDLPEDVRNEIFETVFTSGANTLQGTIDLVKVKSALLGISYDNLKTFTALMDVLAKKFPNILRKKIAEKFNTPIAQEYVTLGEQLFLPVFNVRLSNRQNEQSPVEDMKKLLKKDADPNYSGDYPATRYMGDPGWHTVLEQMYAQILANEEEKGLEYKDGIAIFKLLLEAGAKPTKDFMSQQQKQFNREIGLYYPRANLRRELLDLLKQYTEK